MNPLVQLIVLVFIAGQQQVLAGTWDGRVGQVWSGNNDAEQPRDMNSDYYQYEVYDAANQRVRTTPKRLVKVQLIRNVSSPLVAINQIPKISYFAIIGIGEPVKPLLMHFDVRSSDIWLPEYTWNPFASNLHYGKGYDSDDSKTFEQNKSPKNEYSIVYRGTTLTGYVKSDQFTMGYRAESSMPANFPPLPRAPVFNEDGQSGTLTEPMKFKQNFLAIGDASDGQFKYAAYDGVIGLAPVTQSATGLANLLLSMQESTSDDHYVLRIHPNEGEDTHQWYEEDGLNYEVFSLWINPLLDSRYGGELIFGGLDEMHYVGRVYYHQLTSWFEWQLAAQYVMLGDTTVSCSEGCHLTFDSGEESLIGPQDSVDTIYSTIGSSLFAGTNIQVVDCNTMHQLPLLSFMIDGMNYRLLPSNYIRRTKIHSSQLKRLVEICHVAIRPHSDENWVLGNNFFNAYYTVFDFKNRQMGFAQAR